MKFNIWTETSRILGFADNNYLKMAKLAMILSSYEFLFNQIKEGILLKRMLLTDNEKLAFKLCSKPLFLSISHPLILEYELMLKTKEELERMLSKTPPTNTNKKGYSLKSEFLSEIS